MNQRILHTVNKSPFSSTVLSQCLARWSQGDAILLLEDGVYGALNSHAYSQALSEVEQCYAIEADIIARGLEGELLLPHITLITYEQFVGLSLEYPLSHSWY